MWQLRAVEPLFQIFRKSLQGMFNPYILLQEEGWCATYGNRVSLTDANDFGGTTDTTAGPGRVSCIAYVAIF